LKNTSKIAVLVGICMVVCIAGCGGEDRQKAKLMNDQINIIDEQMEGLDEGHAELTARTDNLEDLVGQMKAELDKSAPAIQAAKGANTRMRELYFGTGSTEGLSDFSPSTWNSTTLLIVAVMVLGLWVLWRMREQKLELAMNREIDQVVNRLSERTGSQSPASSGEVTNGTPKGPDPTPSSAPEPEKETPPEPETPEKAIAEKQVKEPEENEDKAEESALTGPVETGPAEAPSEVTPSEENQPETEEQKRGPEAPQDASLEKEKDVTAGETEEKTESEKEAEETASAKKIKEEEQSTPKPTKKAAKKTARKKPEKKAVKRAPAKKCKVKGCNNKHRSKGFCNKHYQQWRRGTLEEDIEE